LAALRTYHQALAAGFNRADVWVQISRCHYMLGDVADAIQSCETALELDLGNEDARSFLIERGRAALQADRIRAIETGGHPEPLIALAEEVERLAKALDQIRRELPARAQFAYTPHQGYDGFRRRFFLPPAPKAPDGAVLSIVLDCSAATASNVRRLRASLQDQTYNAWRLYLAGGAGNPEIETLVTADTKMTFLAEAEKLPHDIPVLFLDRPAALTTECVQWLAFAGSISTNCLVQIDDVRIERLPNGEEFHFPPDLFGAPDFDFVCQTGNYPAALLWPADERLARARAGDWRAAYLSELRKDRVAHLPLPLVRVERGSEENDDHHVRRTQDLLVSEANISLKKEGGFNVDWSYPNAQIINVIIPTRDKPELIEAMVSSLLEKAQDRASVHVSVIDNNSTTDEAQAAYARLSALPNIDVHKEGGPFNWSKMNNDAARRSSSDILVFANDDMAMLTEGWDIETRSQLSREDIGVLGAMLLYPTGEIQHAGVMLGWRGGPIHEGLAWRGEDDGPGRRWTARRGVSAVTGAFLATTRVLFERLEGFDQVLLPVGGSDLDYSLKVRAAGAKVLWTPHIRLTHHESLSRGLDHTDEQKRTRNEDENAVLMSRWEQTLLKDPHIHPLWANFGRPFQHIAPLNQEKAVDHFTRTINPVAKTATDRDKT
jgi:GT2 family glycosyltransferase/tetratricopeptide (TPR) repeat protein